MESNEHSDLILSASSVSTFLRCGYQWYLSYVAGLKSPPSLRQSIGLAGHKAVEVNMRQKVDSREDLPESDVLDAFSTEFDQLAPDIELDESKDEDLGAGKDSGIKAVSRYHTAAAPRIQPIAVEQPIQFGLETGDGQRVVYSGQVDIIDDDERVRDTKFVGQMPAKGKYDLNMTGYAIGYRQATGRTETNTVLDVIVRNKVPKYMVVEAGGPVTDDQIRSLAFVVEGVADGIRKGNFPANGIEGRGVCDWCGYRAVCPAKKGAR